MAMGPLTIGRPTEAKINSTSNDRTTKGVTALRSLPLTSAVVQMLLTMTTEALSFDSVESTKVSRNADVTSYAVESGSEVSDHVQIRNNKFTLQGRISETVLKLNPDMIKNAGINGNRRMLMLEYLNQLMDSRQPFLLVTELKKL